MKIVINLSEEPIVFSMQRTLGTMTAQKRKQNPERTFLAIYEDQKEGRLPYKLHEFLEWDEKLDSDQLIKVIKYYEKQYYAQDREIENIEDAVSRVRLLSYVPGNQKASERVNLPKNY